MEIRPNPPSPPAVTGQFTWRGLLLGFAIAPIFGLTWAWAAEGVQFYFAPLILFPVLLGVFAGLSIVGMVRFAQIGHRPTIVAAALLAAAVAVGGRHYFGYLEACWATRPSPEMGGPAAGGRAAMASEIQPTFGEYMCAVARRGRPLTHGYVARGWVVWLTWSVDALLAAVAAVAVVIPALRVPYCNRCRTWYRTIRSGRIDAPTAMRLAELIGAGEIDNPRSPRYRLSTCQGGCGPTRCELSWEEAGSAIDLVQVWLDAAQRNRVAALLDEWNAETQKADRGDEAAES